jgi:hypothetical protein
MNRNLSADQFQPQTDRVANSPTPLWNRATFRSGDTPNPLFEQHKFPHQALYPPKGHVMTTEHVPVGALKSTQPTVQSEKVAAMADQDTSGMPPIEVTEYNGDFWLLDGNHRAVTAYVKGEATVPANVLRPRRYGDPA